MSLIFSKSSGLNNSIYGNSQQPIKMLLEQQEEEFQQFSIIPHIYAYDTTINFAEKYTYETSLQDFDAVPENAAYPDSIYQEGYSKVIEPYEWKNRFAVTQTMLEDSKMGKVKSKAYGFMLSYNRTREKLAAQILTGSNTPNIIFGRNQTVFDITCADGQPLFSTAHPSKTGAYGPQTNYFNLPFSYDNLSLVEEYMQQYRDDDGNLLNIQPDTIVIPSKSRIKKLVFDAIGAEETPNTGNNGFNYNFGRWNVVISPYINNPSGVNSDIWFLMDKNFNLAYMGLVWLERLALYIKSYIDENTDANIIKGRARFGAAPNNWRAFSGSYPGLF